MPTASRHRRLRSVPLAPRLAVAVGELDRLGERLADQVRGSTLR